MNFQCIYLIIVFVSFILEQSKSPCKYLTYQSILLSFIHHTISNYSYFGSLLFGYHKFHLLFLFSVFIGWVLMYKFGYKFTCILTYYYNNLCGFDKYAHFNDIVYYIRRALNIKKPSTIGYIIVLVYDILTIYKS